MSKRVMVTGSSGFVAGSVLAQAGDAFEMHALSRESAPGNLPRVCWHTADILDFAGLRRLFDEIKPDVVMHAAGMADIDWCENHQAEATRINVELTRELVAMCKSAGVRMVYTSTDTVFRGDRGMYVESDPGDPVNFYGQTKLAGERAVIDGLSDFAIARLAIVMGLPFFARGHSFLSRLIKVLKEETREIPVAIEEIRTPVDVITLARALLELAGNSYQGIIHLSGNDRMDRLVFSRQIAEHLGFDGSRIVPTQASAMAGRAARPVDVSLSNALAKTTLKTPTHGLIDGLELVMASAKK